MNIVRWAPFGEAHRHPSQASTPPVWCPWQSRRASMAGYFEYL